LLIIVKCLLILCDQFVYDFPIRIAAEVIYLLLIFDYMLLFLPEVQNATENFRKLIFSQVTNNIG